jgi:calcineurin-like phosphoesterase family protein
MIWFTSDKHFDHKNIIKYSNRPFASVEEMNEALIVNHNSVVSKNDTVYDLGDFCLSSRSDYFLSRLNGNIVRIKGSHDRNFNGPRMLVIDSGLFSEQGRPIHITLCHYALRSWQESHYGAWALYGHHHGKLEPYGLSFDVGVDCWNYFPVSLEQVAAKMATLRPIVDFSKT